MFKKTKQKRKKNDDIKKNRKRRKSVVYILLIFCVAFLYFILLPNVISKENEFKEFALISLINFLFVRSSMQYRFEEKREKARRKKSGIERNVKEKIQIKENVLIKCLKAVTLRGVRLREKKFHSIFFYYYFLELFQHFFHSRLPLSAFCFAGFPFIPICNQTFGVGFYDTRHCKIIAIVQKFLSRLHCNFISVHVNQCRCRGDGYCLLPSARLLSIQYAVSILEISSHAQRAPTPPLLYKKFRFRSFHLRHVLSTNLFHC